jgi:hypothetical protein
MIKAQLQKPHLKGLNSKIQTIIKIANNDKAQFEFYQKPLYGESLTSKAQFKRSKFKTPNYKKNSKYRKSLNSILPIAHIG